jgi:hypothetical protein
MLTCVWLPGVSTLKIHGLRRKAGQEQLDAGRVVVPTEGNLLTYIFIFMTQW